MIAVLIWSDPHRDDVVRLFEKQYAAIAAAQTIVSASRRQLEEAELTEAMERDNWIYFAKDSNDMGQSVTVMTREVE